MSSLQKISSIILAIIAVISVVLTLLYFFGPVEFVDGQLQPKWTGEFLGWSLFLLVVAAVVTIGASIVYIVTHPQAIKGVLISLGAIVVVVALSYALASPELPPLPEKFQDLPGNVSRWTGTGLIMTYILAVVAFVGIIFSEIARAFK